MAEEAWREVSDQLVATRNQVIKTENQIKNVGLDFKNLEKRFDSLEKRTRLASLGVYLIIAGVAGVAAFFVMSVREQGYATKIVEMKASTEEAQASAQEREQEVTERLRSFEAKEQAREESRRAALRVMQLIKTDKAKEAVKVATKVDFDLLTDLERELVEPTISGFRREVAEDNYKDGKNHVVAGRVDSAVKTLNLAYVAEPEGPYAQKSLHMRARLLYDNKRYDEAIKALELFRKVSPDKTLKDEAQVLLGISHLKLGHTSEARPLLATAANKPGRLQSLAKNYLSVMDSELINE